MSAGATQPPVRAASTGRTRRAWFLVVSAALPALLGGLIAWRPTRGLGRSLLAENGPVEGATFAAFALAGLWMAARAAAAGRARGGVRLAWWSGLVAVAFLVLAMEEVSWTQWFFGFETPAVVRDVNLQKEFNLHNLPIIQDLNEWFLAVVGILGFAWSRRRPRGVLVVPRDLGPGFVVVALLAAGELISLQFPLGNTADEVVTRLVEVAEMFLALSALGWAWLAGLQATGRQAS